MGASFKIGGKVKPLKLPNFYTKKTKEGTIYVEKIGRRLKKRGSEVKEIKLYKNVKGGIKI